MANLKNNTTTIQSILETVNALPNAGGGGITPTGTKYITKNGTYNVANYAEANVNVPSTIPTGYADVSGVTATTADVLASKQFVTADGALVAGSLINNASVYIRGVTPTSSTTITFNRPDGETYDMRNIQRVIIGVDGEFTYYDSGIIIFVVAVNDNICLYNMGQGSRIRTYSGYEGLSYTKYFSCEEDSITLTTPATYYLGDSQKYMTYQLIATF